MKKIVLSLLMVVMAVSGVFADGEAMFVHSETDGDVIMVGSEGSRNSVYSEVYLNTRGTFQAEIALTSVSAHGANDDNVFYSFAENDSFSPIPGGIDAIELVLNRRTGIASLATSIYASWLIQSGQKFNIYFAASGPLTQIGGDNTINWVVTNPDTGETYIDSGRSTDGGIIADPWAANDKGAAMHYIYQHDPTRAIKNYDSDTLSIQTQELVWHKPAGLYKADLYMLIQVVD